MARRGLLRELLRSGVGRLGVTMAVILGVMAIFVLLTYPADFGPSRWSNPAVWADNPKAVPPAWTNLLGGDRAVHRVLAANEPVEVSQAGPAELRSYQMPFTYGESEPPTFLSFRMGQVSYSGRPPSYSVVLVRPDGQEVTLYRDVVRGPRPDEQAPFVRNSDAPLRVNLGAESAVAEQVAKVLGKAYGVPVDAAALEGRP